MAIRHKAILAILLLMLVSVSSLGLVPYWALEQNDPNPFCNDPGVTQIDFAVDREAEVLLEVMSPDSAAVVRVLVNGILQAGFYSVVWDGRDSAGELLTMGDYPYTMTARIIEGPEYYFQETRIATIECESPAHSKSWGEIKGLYRE